MASHNVTVRPTVLSACQWDGTNLAELEAYVPARYGSYWGWDVTHNDDGTVTIYGGPDSSTIVLAVGDWLSPSYGGIAKFTDAEFRAIYQDVPGGAMFAYTVAAEQA